MSDEIKAIWSRLRQELVAKIEEHGQAVQIVYLTEQDPPGSQPFIYTIGNYHRGLPELLVIGTDKAMFADVLNRLGKIQRERGRGFEDEEIVSVGGKFPYASSMPAKSAGANMRPSSESSMAPKATKCGKSFCPTRKAAGPTCRDATPPIATSRFCRRSDDRSIDAERALSHRLFARGHIRKAAKSRRVREFGAVAPSASFALTDKT